MSLPTEYPTYTNVPETPVRIKEDIVPEGESIIGFDVCLEYNTNPEWLNVACVHHDERLHTDAPNIFDEGIYLQCYKDNQPYRRSPLKDSLDGRPVEECMKFAFQVLEDRVSQIIPLFEEWHEIQAH